MIFPDLPDLIVCPILLPLAVGLFCFVRVRAAGRAALAASLVNLAAVAFLVRRLLALGPERYEIGGWGAPLGIVLRTDGPALIMLVMTAVTGLGITWYGRAYFSFRRSDPKRIGRAEGQARFFWPLWMALFGALNGLFLAGDLFNLYVTLELIGIVSVALAALSGKPASQIAAFRYLLVSLLGSLSYLLGVAFLYKTHGVLDLGLLRTVVRPGGGAGAALVLLTVGLLMKSALFPMHFWLPPAHANALAPVSAILSGLVVKAPFYLVFRFWFEVFEPLASPAALTVLGLLGGGAVLWGGLQALVQQRLKLLIAYSTVSQLGYLFLAFPLVRLNGPQVWPAVLFLAMGHACAKTAMFMAAGTIFLHVGHDRIRDLQGIRASLPITVFAYGIAGVNLMGLPPSGGFVAKWLLLSGALASGQWWWALLLIGGSLLAAAYVYRVICRIFVIPPGQTMVARRSYSALLEWPALALALCSLLLGLLAPWATHLAGLGALAPVLDLGGLP